MTRYKISSRTVEVLLCTVGAILSLILTLHSLSAMDLYGCSGDSSCATVTGSKWSLVMGFLPVSSLSMGLYLAALLCEGFLLFQEDGLLKKILYGLSWVILFGSLWFIIIQAFLVKAFCPYCMSAHFCGILLWALIFLREKKEGILSSHERACIPLAGAFVVAAFAIFQLTTTPSYRSSTGRAEAPLPIPQITESPSIGPIDATVKIALLYDYRCSHCRTVHGLLEDAVDHFGGKVAFILCPTPLSQECNPYVMPGEDRFKGSCTLATLALGLWKESPELFKQFDRWLFSSENGKEWYPRSEEDAKEIASILAPGEHLDEEWVREYLSGSFELFGRTTSEGKSGIPRLVLGKSWVIPETDDLEGLVSIIESLLLAENRSL